MGEYVVELKNITKRFPGVVALSNMQLAVKPGEIHGLIVENGAGKSTLIKVLTGVHMADEGEIYVRGTRLSDLKGDNLTIFRRRNIGFVFQSYNLIPILSVYENIVMPLELDGIQADTDFINAICEKLKITDKLDQMPGQLSGGQQQRAAIARALSTKPAIILADEPTGNLDSKTSVEVAGLLKMSALAFHQTIALVTHDEEIAQMADRIIRIEDGRVYEEREQSYDNQK